MSPLPFSSGRQPLLRALNTFGAAVVHAPPGTGKTTLAPQFIADAFDGRVVVTQPRRVAARSAAARVAQLRGGRVGDEVGYTVRGFSAVSKSTRIEMVTPGVLLRRMLRDPDLPGVRAIVIDEVHERHIESDLVFAFAAQLRELRDDLLVVAMSATVDAQRFADLLDVPEAVVHVPAPIYPIDVRYSSATDSISQRVAGGSPRGAGPRGRPGSAGLGRGSGGSPRGGWIEDFVEAGVRRALAETDDGDVLAFVPTIRATEALAERFGGADGAEVGVAHGGGQVAAFALHGQLSAEEQSRIVNPDSASAPGSRRVIFATDVAESSITVPGVRVVVDSCLSRVARRDSTRGMSVLVTESASQASCIQRAGRAGREGPGTVYRLISATEWPRLPEFSAPAIQTSDLTGPLLDVAAWGAPGGDDLPLPDPFPDANSRAALRTLRRLDAIDERGQITDFGRILAGMPLDPRLARGGLVAIRRVTVSTVARVLNFLDANPPNQSPTQAIRHSSDKDPAVRRLIRLLKPHAPSGDSAAGAGASSEPALTGDDAIAFTIACAYPELIARRVSPGSDRVLTVGGTGAILPRGGHGGGARSHGGGHSGRSGVSISANDEWLAIADIARSESASARASGTGAIIRSAMPISRELAFVAAGGVLRERTATYDLDTRKVHAREVTALGAIELNSAPAKPTAAESEAAVAAALAEHGAEMLQLSKNATALIRRMQYLHDAGVAGYPDLRKPWPTEVTTFAAADIAAGRWPDVSGLLHGLIPWDEPIDELAPEELTLPNERTRRLTYPAGGCGCWGCGHSWRRW